MTIREGSCLCGAVKVSADVAEAVTACHCHQCQIWTGGAPLYSVETSGDVSVTGEENVSAYRASTWGERGFCRHCGTTLWWRMQDKPLYSLSPGLFAGQDGFSISEEIFVDRRAGWMPPVEGAEQSTEAQQIAKFDAYMKRQQT